MITNLQISSSVYIRIETDGPSILLTKIMHDKDNEEFVQTGVMRIPKSDIHNFVEQLKLAESEILK